MKKNAEEQDERKFWNRLFFKKPETRKNVYINTSSHRSVMLYTYSWKAIYKLGTD